ncbi:uncharacterized protein LOC127877358 [Dreissena polymorpha]|uniref:uncharacterized protein LOC127877358 n=1 Tax=Dreissena polymorpha TaxID=45954 RepID=UPI0022649353|nr:uncharacterized protein LOC127877358 [Dreissena polymorpha]
MIRRCQLVGGATVIALVILLNVFNVDAGECCRSHRDLYQMYHYQTWCPDYCCISGGIARNLECCSDISRRTFPSDIDRFCAAWFIYPHNVWVPVIIGLVILGILIGICVCCCRCCFIC